MRSMLLLSQPQANSMNDGFGILLILGIAGMCLAAFAFWLWMLIHALTKQPSGSEKLVWVFVIVLLPFIGSMIYFFVRFLGGSGSSSEMPRT